MLSLFLEIHKQRRFAWTAVVVGVLYLFLYLWLTQFVVIGGDPHPAFGIDFVPDVMGNLFRQRGPFLYESIGTVYLTPWVTLFVSVPNLLIGLFISILVGLNLSVSYFVFRKIGWKGKQGVASLIGTIPALLGGAACCAPILIIVLGLQFTAALSTIWSFLVPLSVILLVASLWWALSQAARNHNICRVPKKKR